MKHNNGDMNLEINNNEIEKSFDRIAKDLLTNYALFVNDNEFRFTEIEFYYYCEKIHEDKYTHEHNRNAGEWRFHNQGFDLTFKSDEKSDGGILIRGITLLGKNVNGPRKILEKIFESFGKAFDNNCFVLKQASSREIDIYKTFRHLPNKNVYENFHAKPYRYLTDLENLDIPNSLKLLIKQDLKKI
jgi:hypothetical protein